MVYTILRKMLTVEVNGIDLKCLHLDRVRASRLASHSVNRRKIQRKGEII